EEVLLDFRELQGEHSGENLADSVWHTMSTYGLKGRVIAINSDNATNNDTMMTGIEARCKKENIPFSAKAARMRCIPHTIHLAALQVCYC
ncbi:uncharacterized protein BXZ73DRAFT_54055, partial [Epithele typhae]|uniref:uncharacterized protein n=1 Tax=Epithele typhae TaxID=378194 RepID=UPI0020075F52